MKLNLALIVGLVISFLLGAIPFAYIFVKKIKGVDIRKEGSGNSGATNASRVVGKKWGLIILALDIAKGAAAAGLVPLILRHWLKTDAGWMLGGFPAVGLCMGLAAFLGHCFSPFLLFKGGKGVATALGVYLVVAPMAVALTAVVCIVLILVTRVVSIASITGAILLPVSIMIFYRTKMQGFWFVFGLTVVLGALVIFRHRSNIRRLIKGAENKA